MTSTGPAWRENAGILRALNASIATPRLVLEPLTAAHAAAMFEPLQDEAIYRWISTAVPGSVEALRDRWARSESRMSPDGKEAWLGWAVRRASDGSYAGKMDVSLDEAGTATNVGYMFFPAFRGDGLATEALIAVVDHLIGVGVERFVATVTVGNTASARVLTKAGFGFTRIIPENDILRGVVHDDEEYVRIAPATAGSLTLSPARTPSSRSSAR